MSDPVSTSNIADADRESLLAAYHALETARDEVLWVDANGCLIYANNSACVALEYSRDELMAMTVSDICPDFPPDLWAAHWRYLKAAGQMVLTVSQRSRSGKTSPVEVSAAFMQHDGREYSCAFMRDIADRTRVEHDLDDTRHQLEIIFDTMQAGIILVSQQGIITYANRRMASMFGCTLDELIGSSYPEHTHPDQRDVGDVRMRRLIDGEIDHVHHERHYIRKDGSDFWGHLSGRRHEDAQGNLISLVGVIADITEIKKAQQAIQVSEERYRTIIENMQDVYYLTDSEGRLIMVSPSGVEMLGYDSVDQLLGCSVRDNFYWDPEERDAFLHNLKLKGKVSGYELALRHRNGSQLPVAVSSHLVLAPDGTFMGVEGVYHDISRFRQAMDQLKASEDKFATAFNQAPVLIIISGIEDGRCLEVNDRFCDIFGFSRQELLGRTSLELGLISSAERERMMAVFRRDGRIRDLEIAMTARDGRLVYCLLSVERVSIDAEDRLLSIALDITTRKQDLEALDYANECFTQALNGSQHILYRLNVKKGGYDYLSPAFEQITGYGVAEFSGTGLERLKDYFHPHDRERVFALIDQVSRTRTGRTVGFDVEYRFRKADNSYCWLHDSTRACFDEQGELECFFGSAHDITQRKRAEDALRESEQRYRTLFDTMQEGFALHEIICDGAGRPVDYRFLSVNASFERLTGLSEAGLIGRTVLEVLPATEPYWIETYGKVALTGEPVFFENYSRELDRHYEVHAYRPSPGCFAAVFSDVTERRILQQEREKSQRLSSLGVLAGGIAHDFNNILTGIIGNISIAEMQLGQGHKATARLKECQAAARRATELTQQLLTFAKGGEPVKHAVDTGRLINESLSFCLLGSNVKGTFVCASDLWRINADAGQINQVLNNLLINARQAMEAGGRVSVRAENCEIHKGDSLLLEPSRYVRIVVEDEGCGIPAAELPRIFDPYFTTKERGTGLGLTSVYSIVHRHGGQVEVSSVAGRGATFTIYLPAFDGNVDEEAHKGHEGVVVAGKGRILVMDDEEMIRDLAAIMLEEAGYLVESCDDGSRAVARFMQARVAGTPFDAVILDLTVPGGMGGKTAAALIREQDPDVVLLVSSGYSNDPIMADFLRYGFSGTVAKPYTIEAITGELSRLLAGRS